MTTAPKTHDLAETAEAVVMAGAAICSASVLDVCCGSRMFWFDRKDDRAVFVDKRRESHSLRDKSSRGGSRTLTINPDIVADFTSLPFQDNKFCGRHLRPAAPHTGRQKGLAGEEIWEARRRLAQRTSARLLRMFPRPQARGNADFQMERT